MLAPMAAVSTLGKIRTRSSNRSQKAFCFFFLFLPFRQGNGNGKKTGSIEIERDLFCAPKTLQSQPGSGQKDDSQRHLRNDENGSSALSSRASSSPACSGFMQDNR